jgi:branched-subunit amino acid ABC-type transport system permease component
MNVLSQTIISGLLGGAVYALLGVGLVIVYRTSRVLNLAHGEAYAIAGIVAAIAMANGIPIAGAIVLALIASILFSLALYRFVLRPREHWPMPTLVLITLGAAFLSRGILNAAIGPDPISFAALFRGPPIPIAGGAIPLQGLVLIVTGFVLSLGVAVFLQHARLGKELLATAENARAAQLLGINVERARLIAFGLSGLLAGAAAVLLVPLLSVDYQTGLSMTLRGFIAAAIAGMMPSRVVLCGFLLGLFEAVVGSYLGALYQDPVMFCILIIVAVWQSRSIRFGGARRA